MTPDPRTPASTLRRLASVEPGELSLVAWSAAYFFFLFASYYLVRPVREAMGIERSADDLPWLMTGTLAAMFLANPAFSALVARFPRRRFIPYTYHFFALNMLVFAALLWLLPSRALLGAGYAFYIWLSVFNLFAVSVFWSLMADIFSRDQGKRLFPMIGVGGTLGAIAGPAAATWLAPHTPPAVLILIAAALLEAAVLCVAVLTRLSGLQSARPSTPEPGPSVLDGMGAVARSPYLLLVCLHYFLYTLVSTFLYLEQGRIVKSAIATSGERTALFASIDLWTNVLTLSIQLLVGGRLLTWIGVGPALALIPLISAIGFAALWGAPLLGIAPLGVLVAFQIARRGVNYSLSNPARQVLFTVVGPDQKYKSKAFIDTFVYRAGDLAGAWAPKAIVAAGAAVAMVALPIGILGVTVALSLGGMLHRRRPPPAPPPGPSCPACGYSLAGLQARVCPECGGQLP